MKRFIQNACPHCGGLDGLARGGFAFCTSARLRWRTQWQSRYQPDYASDKLLEEIGFAQFRDVSAMLKLKQMQEDYINE